MAKFAMVKCWYVPASITDPDMVSREDPSFSVVKKSILKNGYRGFAIEERSTIESQGWYREFLLGEEVRFYLDGSGIYRLANCDLTDNELYFERLNVPMGYRPWIFYSWQSDHNPSRSKIRDALEDAVRYINENLSPKQPLEILESTRAEDGAKNIVEAIKSNIDRSMFTIFDITNVSKVLGEAMDGGDKHYPNANVVFELSYALARKNPEQVLMLKQDRTKEISSDSIPFDIDQNKRVDFSQPAKLKKEVKSILVDYLRRRNFIQADD
jgi:hypothetical protein